MPQQTSLNGRDTCLTCSFACGLTCPARLFNTYFTTFEVDTVYAGDLSTEFDIVCVGQTERTIETRCKGHITDMQLGHTEKFVAAKHSIKV
jgi:hypothetical protein